MLHSHRLQWPALALVAACGTGPDSEDDKAWGGSDSGGGTDLECGAPTLDQEPAPAQQVGPLNPIVLRTERSVEVTVRSGGTLSGTLIVDPWGARRSSVTCRRTRPVCGNCPSRRSTARRPRPCRSWWARTSTTSPCSWRPGASAWSTRTAWTPMCPGPPQRTQPGQRHRLWRPGIAVGRNLFRGKAGRVGGHAASGPPAHHRWRGGAARHRPGGGRDLAGA